MPIFTLPLVSPNRGCYNFRARLRDAFCQMFVPFRKSSEMQMGERRFRHISDRQYEKRRLRI